MKTLLKYLLIGVLAIAVLIGSVVALMLLDERKANSPKSAKQRIQNAAQIVFPKDADMVYLDYDQPWGPDRFSQYAVFSFKEEPINWLTDNAFSKEKSTEFEKEFEDKLPSGLKETLKKEYSPNFEGDYQWLALPDVTSGYLKVYFIYQPQEYNLIVYIPAI